MRKILIKWTKFSSRSQNAQGIVEFALVLPILLMLVLGIIAFGHLFFVYSMTVSASREAARFGAAVGVTDNGIARYRDCGAIRNSALQYGRYAGVTDANIQIEYDRGPTSPVNVYGNCPLTGPGPLDSSVRLGDRVVVTVTTQYTPIVPFVNLPSFPLSAVTARTIIKALPVGDVPPAQDACTVRTELEWSHLPNPSSSSVPVPFTQRISTHNGNAPGTLKVLIEGVVQPDCTTNDPATGSTCNLTFTKAGPLRARWVYTSSDPCYPDLDYWEYHYVDVTHTKTSILPKSPNNAVEDIPVLFEAKVEFRDAAGFVNEGQVVFRDVDKPSITCTASVQPATGVASCYLTWGENEIGLREIQAEYSGTEKFFGSTSEKYKFNIGPRPSYLLKVVKDLQVGSSGSVFSSPAGIDCGFTCEAKFKEGTIINLNAVPDTGSSFAGWLINGSLVTTNPYQVTLTADRTITAVFTVRFRLTVAVSGNGSVTSSPAGIDCGSTCQAEFVKGTNVTLTAKPGHPNQVVFIGWSGAVTGSTNPITVPMDAAKSVTALFKLVDASCPTFSKNHPSQFRFNIVNKSTSSYTIDNIKLQTPAWTTANTKLHEIRFDNSCGNTAPGNGLFCSLDGLLAPPPSLDPSVLTFWAGAADPNNGINSFTVASQATIPPGTTKQMTYEFTNPWGIYVATITFRPISEAHAPCVLVLDNNYR